MAGTSDLWVRIVERWRRERIAIRPGASAAAIQDFETRWSVVLPKDLHTYFGAVDGMDPGVMDDHAIRFWPLAEVMPVHEELSVARTGVVYPDRAAYPNCFLIADWAIWAWGYAVRLTQDSSQPAPVFRVTGGDPPGEQVAPSFRDFMERYAEDPDSVSVLGG